MKQLFSIGALAALAAVGPAAAAAQIRVQVGQMFRQADRQEVMLQLAGHCHVTTSAQVDAFGGWSRVIVVPTLNMRGHYLGSCGWPNGFYRRTNEQAVYRLSGQGVMGLGSSICHVVSPAQLEGYGGWGVVKVVEAGADLNLGRVVMTPCRDHLRPRPAPR